MPFNKYIYDVFFYVRCYCDTKAMVLMRLVFIDLHSNSFMMRNAFQLLTRKRAITKHEFLLEYLNKEGVELVNFITGYGSTMPKQLMPSGEKYKFLHKLESKFVIGNSKFKNYKITIITDVNELKPDDILIFYVHFIERYLKMPCIQQGIKIVDFLHFYGESVEAVILQKQRIDYGLSEINLKKFCKLYLTQYDWLKNDIVINPLSFQPRFQNKIPFAERKNRVVAMGTLTYRDSEEFIKCYGSNVYQPHRKMIYDNAEKLTPWLDSYIEEYKENNEKNVKYNDNILVKFWKKLYNMYNVGKQKKYFSFNMVEKYNEYKMFICPEDINGSYGIGSIEGMACGCAMIGIDIGIFEDMGMQAGVHYIPYDGTLDGLITTMIHYQCPENADELEKIAVTGCRFVREKFSQEKVAALYYENMKKILLERVCSKK